MKATNMRHVIVEITGLSCGGGGALAVERALARTPGVAQVYVNPLTEMAYVDYDPAQTGLDKLVAAVERAGFRAGHPVER